MQTSYFAYCIYFLRSCGAHSQWRKYKENTERQLSEIHSFIFRAPELSLKEYKKKKKRGGGAKNCFHDENGIYKIQSQNTYVLVSHIYPLCALQHPREFRICNCWEMTYTIPKYSHSFLYHVKLFPNRSFYWCALQQASFIGNTSNNENSTREKATA